MRRPYIPRNRSSARLHSSNSAGDIWANGSLRSMLAASASLSGSRVGGSTRSGGAARCSAVLPALAGAASDSLDSECGKIKPKLVQKSLLRKSQDLHLDAVPTTYAQRSLRKRGSHTQALRFGTAQPFWTLSQRCCSKTRTKAKTSKTSWTKPRDCLRLLLCSFLGFEPKATIQLDCNNCLNVQDPKIFLLKAFFH